MPQHRGFEQPALRSYADQPNLRPDQEVVAVSATHAFTKGSTSKHAMAVEGVAMPPILDSAIAEDAKLHEELASARGVGGTVLRTIDSKPTAHPKQSS